jgi:hypothetical protein
LSWSSQSSDKNGGGRVDGLRTGTDELTDSFFPFLF